MGEAYANSGRYSAALKAFSRAETLNPGNWYARYILGNVHGALLDYEEACKTFRGILAERPSEFHVSLALAQTLLSWSYSCLRSGEFSRSVDLALESAIVACNLLKSRPELSETWKLIGDAAYVGSLVQISDASKLADLISETIRVSHEQVSDEPDLETVNAEDGGNCSARSKLLRCNVAAMEKMVALTEGDRLAHSAAHFNLGVAKYHQMVVVTSGSTSATPRPVLECFRKAIQLEPRNFQYWNAIGVSTAFHFPAVAEKAFSRSLEINERVNGSFCNCLHRM